MNSLAKHDARQMKIIELHFYGGLTFSEIAEVLGLSRSTVMRQWKSARKWLSEYLIAKE